MRGTPLSYCFIIDFKILLDFSREEIEKESLPEIAEGIMRMREGKVLIDPGYDGVYGKIKLFSRSEGNPKNRKQCYPQKTLF